MPDQEVTLLDLREVCLKIQPKQELFFKVGKVVNTPDIEKVLNGVKEARPGVRVYVQYVNCNGYSKVSVRCNPEPDPST